MTWHASDLLFGDYADGSLDPARASSLEAHLVNCASCRARVVPLSDLRRAERVWAGVQREMDVPEPGPVEALLPRIGLSDHVARLLAATPSLSFSWLAAVALTLTFAIVAAHQVPRGAMFFVLLAPLLPVAGVAAAYGPSIDPIHEIGLASPMSSFRVLLIRSTAVLITTFALVGLFAFGLPGLGWTAAAWLLPGLALTLSSLALATWVPLVWAASLVSIFWIGGVVLAERASGPTLAALHGPVLVAFAAIAILAASILVTRRRTFELRSER